MAAWNSGDVASVEASLRNRAIRLLRPAPNSPASRSLTVADSEVLSSQPPEVRSSDARDASASEPTASTTVARSTQRRNR